MKAKLAKVEELYREAYNQLFKHPDLLVKHNPMKIHLVKEQVLKDHLVDLRANFEQDYKYLSLARIETAIHKAFTEEGPGLAMELLDNIVLRVNTEAQA